MAYSRIAMAGVAALALGGAMIGSTSSADARPGFRGNFGGGGFRGFGGQRFGGFRGGRGYGRGFGYAGAGLAGGLALGALAASSYPYGYGGYGGYGYAGDYAYGGSNCYVEPRQVISSYGYPVVRNVEVCY